MARTESQPRFLLCVRNEGYPASLEVREVYQAVPDATAAGRYHVRVVDESGEDYIYPEEYFVPIELPEFNRAESILVVIEDPRPSVPGW